MAIALDGGHALRVFGGGDRALLRVEGPGGMGLALEVHITPEGPVVRAFAHALELEASSSITARCERFEVEARAGIALQSGGDLTLQAAGTHVAQAARIGLEATRGRARIEANDEVQLMGAEVLLNAEPDAPLPAWVPLLAPLEVPHDPAQATVADTGGSGDAALASVVLGTRSST